jgi:hypothetical protein
MTPWRFEQKSEGINPFENSDLFWLENFILERAKRFELSTPTLARLCSTTELRPHPEFSLSSNPAEKA